MAYRRTPFAPNEWYHCFSRGIDKRASFEHLEDFKRFTELLYLANNTDAIGRENFPHLPHEEIFALPRTEPLVAIAGYCLMRNHYHLLIQELAEGGISKFMHKLGTGYTGYFNLRNDRIGNLFVKPFRSKHVKNDRYLRRVLDYIHLNPVETFELGWKKGKVKDIKGLEKKLRTYTHSSLPDYLGEKRAERPILDERSIAFLKHERPPLRALLNDMATYYEEVGREFGLKAK